MRDGDGEYVLDVRKSPENEGCRECWSYCRRRFESTSPVHMGSDAHTPRRTFEAKAFKYKRHEKAEARLLEETKSYNQTEIDSKVTINYHFTCFSTRCVTEERATGKIGCMSGVPDFGRPPKSFDDVGTALKHLDHRTVHFSSRPLIFHHLRLESTTPKNIILEVPSECCVRRAVLYSKSIPFVRIRIQI